jgi:hypothetical protein
MSDSPISIFILPGSLSHRTSRVDGANLTFGEDASVAANIGGMSLSVLHHERLLPPE